MPELLLEFFSEEIPARMQRRAEEDLARLLGEGLAGAGLGAVKARTLSGPRRIAAIVEGLPARAPDAVEERKGPRVGAPEQAVAGFLKAAGLKSIDEAQIVDDPKGGFYVARTARAGRPIPALLAELVPEIARKFPWPKSMRSGTSDFTWVRPLKRVLCVFDGAAVPFEIGGVTAGAETEGHRFHAPGAFAVKNAAEYEAKLKTAHVLADREARKAHILARAKAACDAQGLELVDDAGLLDEVTGLAEWPVCVLGAMDPAFLDLPAELIRLTMRTHQRYFAVRDPKTGELAPRFLVVANVEAADGGTAIAAGNARVLSARLNDARFFWDTDRFYDPIEKTKPKPLGAPERIEKLKSRVFHQKLGSEWEKAERVAALGRELAAYTGADPGAVEQAAKLAKADLVTETVGEFPELQGQIGRRLYLLEKGLAFFDPQSDGRAGERSGGPILNAASSAGASPVSRRSPTISPEEARARSIAAAIEDHYRPLGPNDRTPTDPVAVTLALADKLDTLVGFWAIDERPTGSSDPYALRRAALGLIRVVLENNLTLSLRETTAPSVDEHWGSVVTDRTFEAYDPAIKALHASGKELDASAFAAQVADNLPSYADSESLLAREQIATSLLAFLADRLKIRLRDQGKRHDLVDAVFSLGDDDLVRIVARVEALEAFLKTEDGSNLLAAAKRAENILRIEEKKDPAIAAALKAGEGPNPALFQEKAEHALHAALLEAGPAARAAAEKEAFGAAMAALARLRAPADAFFDAVLVNAEDASLRRNRLLLLAQIREALSGIADFSKIEG